MALSPSVCCLCGKDGELGNHLFRHCIFATKLCRFFFFCFINPCCDAGIPYKLHLLVGRGREEGEGQNFFTSHNSGDVASIIWLDLKYPLWRSKPKY